MNSPVPARQERPRLAGGQRRGGRPRRPVGVGPLGRRPPGHPRPARTRHGALRRDQPALAPRPGQALVPVPPGDRLRVHDHRRRGAGADPVLPVPRRAPPAGRGAERDHPAGPGGLPVLAAHRGILGVHPGAVLVDDPGVLRRLPPPRLAARPGRQRDHLRRGAPLPPRRDRPVHPRVRDGPAGVRRGPREDPAHHDPQPRRGADRDRTARRGRVQPPVQPCAR